MTLPEILAYGRKHCAHYQRLPNESALIGPADPKILLEDFPLLDRHAVQHSRTQLLALGQDSRRWKIARTTGTTGEPVEIFIDEGAQESELRTVVEHVTDCLIGGIPLYTDLIHITLHPTAVSRAMSSGNPSIRNVCKWNLVRLWQLDDLSLVQSLNCLGGAIVTALPSVFGLLISRLKDFKMSLPRPLIIVLSGEQISDELTDSLREKFCCPVTRLYVLTEAGVVGTACLTGGYHVARRSVYLEVISGEIVVTPLNNTASVLIRYCTGDKGEWLNGPCSCGRSEPRFNLIGGRKPRWLKDPSGRALNTVRFAKVLSQFDVDQIAIDQGVDGKVEVSYIGPPLSEMAGRVLEDALYCALGPKISLQIARVSSFAKHEPSEASLDHAVPEASRAEPNGPHLTELVDWLRQALSTEPEILFAAIVGSAIQPTMTTRFSDIDLLVLVQGSPLNPKWSSLARRLRSSVPTLAVHFDRSDGLPRRAPLLVSRLLSEHRLLIGDTNLAGLTWPQHPWICEEARFWSQTTLMELQHRIARNSSEDSTLVDAWISSKYALNAIRFRNLIRGATSIDWKVLLDASSNEADELRSVMPTIVESFEIAREHCLPRLSSAGSSLRFLAAAQICVATLSLN